MMITIDKITFAAAHMKEMIAFCAEVFDIELKPVEMFERTLYTGKLGKMELLFCPKDLAQAWQMAG